MEVLWSNSLQVKKGINIFFKKSVLKGGHIFFSALTRANCAPLHNNSRTPLPVQYFLNMAASISTYPVFIQYGRQCIYLYSIYPVFIQYGRQYILVFIQYGRQFIYYYSIYSIWPPVYLPVQYLSNIAASISTCPVFIQYGRQYV